MKASFELKKTKENNTISLTKLYYDVMVNSDSACLIFIYCLMLFSNISSLRGQPINHIGTYGLSLPA